MSGDNRFPLYQGTIVDLGLETTELPGGDLITLEIVRHPGGAVVAALDRDGRVCLLRQYRHAAGGWIWELPAGVIDEGETPDQTARRELTEEASLQASKWQPLSSILPSPGFCDEELHLYLASDLAPDTSAAPRDDERIEVHWIDFAEALRMAVAGEIRDAKTCVGLMRAAATLGISPGAGGRPPPSGSGNTGS